MLNKYFFISLILIAGCIKESSATYPVEDFQTSATLLGELESRGDFINSLDFPAIVDADYVYQYYSEFYIIELRNLEDYNSGHLENSVRLNNTQLFEHTANIETSRKILLVSNTGQSSAYYTALLRFYGLKNVFSLNFGISSWNQDFSHYYLPYLHNVIDTTVWNLGGIYTNKPYPKNRFSELPLIEAESESIQGLLNERINNLLNEDFAVNAVTRDFIDFRNTEENYTICYGTPSLYYVFKTGDPRFPGHPIVAVFYNSSYISGDLKSTTNLQTIPPDKNVYIYSYSGQRSAILAAYLQLLGFNAKSILFGGHNMFARRFVINNDSTDAPDLVQYGYLNNIKNYPYVK